LNLPALIHLKYLIPSEEETFCILEYNLVSFLIHHRFTIILRHYFDYSRLQYFKYWLHIIGRTTGDYLSFRRLEEPHGYFAEIRNWIRLGNAV